MTDNELLDLVYEAAVLPSRWVQVLDALAMVAGGVGTDLHTATTYGQSLLVSPRLARLAVEWPNSRWNRNPRLDYLVPIQEPRFLRDHDAIPAAVIETDPYYVYMRSLGLGLCAGTTIRSAGTDTVILSIERAHMAGPVPDDAIARLDRLRPHLARAAVLTARVGLERAEASVQAMQLAGLPAAVMSGEARVLAANAAFSKLAPAIGIGAFDRLHVAEPGLRARFNDVLGGTAFQDGCSLPLREIEGDGRAILHVLPLRRDASDLFSGATWLVYAATLDRSPSIGAELLQSLFDLTAGEARIVNLLIQGFEVGEIARQQRIQENTVRAHLKSVYAKAGVRGQVQLVRLLSAAA